MKKLMTALAVCAVASLSLADGTTVTSANIVGYCAATANGVGALSGTVFEKVGGGTPTFSQLYDTSAMLDWVDNVAVFNPADGTFPTYYWGAGGIEGQFDTIGDPAMPLGFGLLTSLTPAKVNQAGQVHDITTPYTHHLAAGASIVSSAWPVPFNLSKFDWSGLAPYSDNIGIFNAADGTFATYTWDGTGFTQDFATYPLSGEIGGSGFAILVGNSYTIDVVEQF